jgi:hypothetical protein
MTDQSRRGGVLEALQGGNDEGAKPNRGGIRRRRQDRKPVE